MGTFPPSNFKKIIKKNLIDIFIYIKNRLIKCYLQKTILGILLNQKKKKNPKWHKKEDLNNIKKNKQIISTKISPKIKSQQQQNQYICVTVTDFFFKYDWLCLYLVS